MNEARAQTQGNQVRKPWERGSGERVWAEPSRHLVPPLARLPTALQEAAPPASSAPEELGLLFKLKSAPPLSPPTGPVLSVNSGANCFNRLPASHGRSGRGAASPADCRCNSCIRGLRSTKNQLCRRWKQTPKLTRRKSGAQRLKTKGPGGMERTKRKPRRPRQPEGRQAIKGGG